MQINSDWEYLAEGNLHVVLKSNNNEYKGKVIKLTKQTQQKELNTSYINKVLLSFENYVPEKLVKYIPAQQTLIWSSDRITQIAQSIEESRPQNRRQRQIDPTLPIVMTENLFEDFDKFFPHQQIKSFNIEIKPKSFLPLYCKDSNQESKFFLIQLKKAQEKLIKMGKSFNDALKEDINQLISKYNPEFFFSGDQGKVKQSILQLLENLENNLKLFQKGNFYRDSSKFLSDLQMGKDEVN